MSKRHVKRHFWLVAGLGLGFSMLQPTGAAEQQASTSTAADEVETRGDALPPGVLLYEESTRGLELPPGESLRLVFAEGLDVTKKSEGWRSRRYNDSAMYCTVGYGHLITVDKKGNPIGKHTCDGSEPAEFIAGITETRGEDLLRGDMGKAEIAAQVLVSAKLDDAQYAAVVDFIFNVGVGNFQSSTLRTVINAGPRRYAEIPYQFKRWVLAGGKPWPGLQTRREREVELFFHGIGVPRGAEKEVPEEDRIDIRTGKPQGSDG